MVAFLVVYSPLYGYISFKKFKNKIQNGSEVRIEYYKQLLLELWVPILAVIIMILISPISLRDLGIKAITILENKWMSYVIWALFTIHLGSMIYHVYSMKHNHKYREKLKKSDQIDEIKFMLPVTYQEQRIWNVVSISAGITEEILYRGFLVFFLTYNFECISIWVAIVISAVIFGLGHTYQGMQGVAKTTLVGVYFGLLYIGFGSIIPTMIIHTFADWISKDLNQTGDYV